MPLVVAVVAAVMPATAAEDLSDKDREALLSKLDVIRDDNQAKVAARFRTATAAFTSAMSSNSEALKFYLDCTKKVDFDDKDRPFREFREWRDRNDEKFSSQEFRLALRYQLRWFVLTLKAASDIEDASELSGEASAIIGDMFSNTEKLQGQKGVLQQGVNGTIFARAYKLNNISVKKWPMSPLPMASVFDQVILPPLRNRGNVERLHSAWESRIRFEGQVVKILAASLRSSGGSKDRNKKDNEALAYERFVTERQPDLIWAMEVDCFKAGDEREGARRMFRHLTSNLSHSKASAWESQFRELITPKSRGEAAMEEGGSPEPAPTPVERVVKRESVPAEPEPEIQYPEEGLDPFLAE